MVNCLSEANFQSIIAALAGLGGICLGALLHYLHDTRMRNKETIEAQVNSGNNAIFKLFEQINALGVIKKQIYDPHRDNGLRFFKVRHMADGIDPNISINCESLLYLMGKDHKLQQLILDLSIANQKYKTIALIINNRNGLYAEVKRKFEEAKISEGAEINEEEIRAVLGEVLYHELRDMTEYVYRLLPEYIEYLTNVVTALNDALKVHYPSAKLFRFTINKEAMI